MKAEHFRVYLIVDNNTKQLIESCSGFGECKKALESRQKKDEQGLSMHNITHPRCPAWIQELGYRANHSTPEIEQMKFAQSRAGSAVRSNWLGRAAKSREEKEQAISHLLANLRHLCDREELDFAILDRRGHDEYQQAVVTVREQKQALGI